MTRPSLFVGSSSEGLEFARAIRGRLHSDAEIYLWDEGFFPPGSTVIETLITRIHQFDFAVLVLTPDDLTIMRQAQAFGPRDNVIFELGLFMGHLGRRRTFVVHQSNSSTKIPSDLAGVTLIGYDWPNSEGNYERAVGRACDTIRQQIRQLGEAVHKLNRHLAWINWLSQRFLSHQERAHLRALNNPGPFIADIERNPKLKHELRRLAELGLVMRKKDKTIESLFQNGDVKEVLNISKEGQDYLRFYEKSSRFEEAK
jgi:hypothetical protein